MARYPVHRHRLPLRTRGRSSRASSVKLAAVMIMPARAEAALERLGVEKRLLHADGAAVRWASPSIVVTFRSAARNAGMRQLWIGVPSSQTVQAPQSP